MLHFKDFAPRVAEQAGFFTAARFAGLEDALAQANAWLKAGGVAPLTVETVVLPNVWEEEGTTDAELRASGKVGTHWYQIVRVWYQD